MDMVILKKKIDGNRESNGSIKHEPMEQLLELRQTWEHYTGSADQFRSELGVKTGTLRNLLKESKKLNHVIGSAGAVGLAVGDGDEEMASSQEVPSSMGQGPSSNILELTFDNGSKTIRFPTVDLLVDFMRKAV